jgi:DNA-binding MarR family transcriptional regulator
LLAQVARRMSTRLDREFEPLGLTSQQAAILLQASRQPTGPAMIAGVIGTDTAGMTRLLDRLEGKSLIRRRPRPDDRRSIVIELTPEGLALVPRLGPIFGRLSLQLLDGLSDRQLDQLHAVLRRLWEVADTPSGAAEPATS